MSKRRIVVVESCQVMQCPYKERKYEFNKRYWQCTKILREVDPVPPGTVGVFPDFCPLMKEEA